MMLTLAIAIFIMISGSALCSGTETALLSISPLKARQLAQSQKPAALALLAIRQRVNRPIATIVILNNLFNIVGSIIIGSIATRVFGDALFGVFSGALTFSVIVFAEILPKTFAERYAISIGMAVAIPVRTLTYMFTPLVWVLEKITAPFVSRAQGPIIDESEIKLMAAIGHQEGLIEADEAEMIRRVFRLNDTKAAAIMTPRVAVTALPATVSIADARQDILNSQHSRILVYDPDIDHVTGLVLKDDLLSALVRNCGEHSVGSLVRSVRFISESEPADRLLQGFQSAHEHLAVVVDEYGGVSGVVTLEDVLEVLTGEIVDETDRNIDLQALARQRRQRLLQSRGFGNSDGRQSRKPGS